MLKIAIASGKGGTGKTFIATNIFNALLHNNQSTMLVDCDAEAPNAIAFFDTTEKKRTEVNHLVPVINTSLCTYCGKCREYCSYNAIFLIPPARIINVIEDLCHGCGACSVACTDNAITEKPVSLGQVIEYRTKDDNMLIESLMRIGVMSPVPVIKAAIKMAGNNEEIIIFDSPPGTSCPFIQTVSATDYVILVTEPTPFGFSDLKQSVETLRIINKPFGVILNRSNIGDDRVKQYLLNENINLLLEIPFSKEIAGLYSNGILVSENDSHFKKQLLTVFETIFAQHGNSGNKR
jgi:MinD superfamily P-loop ATPase